jgi:hypothetical protein
VSAVIIINAMHDASMPLRIASHDGEMDAASPRVTRQAVDVARREVLFIDREQRARVLLSGNVQSRS